MKKLILASWWGRFWAWVIDIIILGIILGIVNFNTSSFFDLWVLSLNTFGAFLYWGILEGYKGQSIGKMALNLRVVTKNGKRADPARSFVSSFGKAYLLPLDCIIGWLAFPEKRMRLFNRASNTIVISVKAEKPKGVRYVKAK